MHTVQRSATSPDSPTMRKRQRTLDAHPGSTAPSDSAQQPPPPPQQQQPHHPVGTFPGQPGTVPPGTDDGFVPDPDAAIADSGGDEDDDEEKPKTDKKAGRRKIKIEFIQDKSRRHITFSKRKAGIMKKAYELSTLTGTQVLLLVVSETGLVYTFTTAKLQPLVTQPEGKNLIQACLNAPHGTLPSSMPVGTPLGRSSQMSMSSPTAPPSNLPGGLAISGGGGGGSPGGGPPGGLPNVKDDDDDDALEDGAQLKSGDKRRRRTSSTTNPASVSPGGRGGPGSPHAANASIPPPLSIPQHPGSAQQQQTAQITLGASPTSPQQPHTQVPASPQYPSPSYGHHHPSPHQQAQQQAQQQQQQAAQDHMYPQHLISPAYSYPGSGSGQPLGGLAAAAAQQHGHWAGPPPQQVGQSGGHYGRR